MYETRALPVLNRRQFLLRMMRHAAVAFALLALSLFGGMAGYAGFEQLSWTDAFLDASMILGGMGPVDVPKTEAGKLFAGTYALYSGLIFLIGASLLIAPVAHRLLHRFHWEGPSRE